MTRDTQRGWCRNPTKDVSGILQQGGLKLVAPQVNTPTEVMIFIWNTPITLRLGTLNRNIILKMMVYEYPYLPLPITWNLVDPKKVKGKGWFLSLELNLEYPSSPLKLLRSESLNTTLQNVQKEKKHKTLEFTRPPIIMVQWKMAPSKRGN